MEICGSEFNLLNYVIDDKGINTLGIIPLNDRTLFEMNYAIFTKDLSNPIIWNYYQHLFLKVCLV